MVDLDKDDVPMTLSVSSIYVEDNANKYLPYPISTQRGDSLSTVKHANTIDILSDSDDGEEIGPRRNNSVNQIFIPIPRPKIVEEIFDCFSAIDIHDQYRQRVLHVEDRWATKN